MNTHVVTSRINVPISVYTAFTSCIFRDNSTLWIVSGKADIQNTTFENNIVSSVLSTGSGYTSIVGSRFINNKIIAGSISGSSIFVELSGQVYCRDSYFYNNTGPEGLGGSLYVSYGGEASIYWSTFDSSLPYSSSILVQSGSLSLESCTLTNDSVETSIYNGDLGTGSPSRLSVSNTVIIQSEQPTFFFDNQTYVTLNSLTLLQSSSLSSPWSSSSSSPSTRLIGYCNDTTITTNSNALYEILSQQQQDLNCDISLSGKLLDSNEKVTITALINESQNLYYSWQNNASFDSLSVSISSKADIYTQPLLDLIEIALVASPFSGNPVDYPDLNNAKWVSRLTTTNDPKVIEAGITLNALNGTLTAQQLYAIGVVLLPKTSASLPPLKNGNVSTSSLIELTLSTQSIRTSLDVTLSSATQMPRVAFLGDPVALNLTFVNTWGTAYESQEPHSLQYGDGEMTDGDNGSTNATIYAGGVYYFRAPLSIKWKPLQVQKIYLDGVAIGKGIGNN